MLRDGEPENPKKSDLCPLCGQYMDLIVVSHRNKPFVDGQLYPKMCFGCFHVPMLEDYTYKDDDGSIEEILGPWFDHKHLHRPECLLEQGTCKTLLEARKCVKAVKNAIKFAGLSGRSKPVTKPPRPSLDVGLNPNNVI